LKTKGEGAKVNEQGWARHDYSIDADQQQLQEQQEQQHRRQANSQNRPIVAHREIERDDFS
jgi:hypothetical protein